MPSSAWPIIAVDLYDSRLGFTKKYGATHLINSSNQNSKEEIRKILKDSPLDVFVDNTGLPNVIEMGYEITGQKGE